MAKKLEREWVEKVQGLISSHALIIPIGYTKNAVISKEE